MTLASMMRLDLLGLIGALCFLYSTASHGSPWPFSSSAHGTQGTSSSAALEESQPAVEAEPFMYDLSYSLFDLEQHAFLHLPCFEPGAGQPSLRTSPASLTATAAADAPLPARRGFLPLFSEWAAVEQLQADYMSILSSELSSPDLWPVDGPLGPRMVGRTVSSTFASMEGVAPEQPLPYVMRVQLPRASRVAVFGDLHGSYHSFLRSLRSLVASGHLQEDSLTVTPGHYLLFLGDYVDRGHYGVETLLTLLLLRSRNPTSVFVSRGNHEDEPQNHESVGGTFIAELQRRYGKRGGAGGTAVPWERLRTLFRVYDTLPRAVYLGYLDPGTGTGKGKGKGKGGEGGKAQRPQYLQCNHGGLEVGFNPLPLLTSPPVVRNSTRGSQEELHASGGVSVTYALVHGYRRADWLHTLLQVQQERQGEERNVSSPIDLASLPTSVRDALLYTLVADALRPHFKNYGHAQPVPGVAGRREEEHTEGGQEGKSHGRRLLEQQHGHMHEGHEHEHEHGTCSGHQHEGHEHEHEHGTCSGHQHEGHEHADEDMIKEIVSIEVSSPSSASSSSASWVQAQYEMVEAQEEEEPPATATISAGGDTEQLPSKRAPSAASSALSPEQAEAIAAQWGHPGHAGTAAAWPLGPLGGVQLGEDGRPQYTRLDPADGFLWNDFLVDLQASVEHPLGTPVKYSPSRGFGYGKPLTQYVLATYGLVGVLRAHQHNDAHATGPMLSRIREKGGLYDNWNSSHLALTFLSGANIPHMGFHRDAYGLLTLHAADPWTWTMELCGHDVEEPYKLLHAKGEAGGWMGDRKPTRQGWAAVAEHEASYSTMCSMETRFVCEPTAWVAGESITVA